MLRPRLPAPVVGLCRGQPYPRVDPARRASGDPALDRHADDIAAIPGLAWLGYLSTTGVYGDRAGGWVDENSELRPSGPRGQRRVAAEAGWQGLWRRRGVPVHIFRLAAIYGPGRSPFDALRAGTARRIAKPGQVFSRIHVDDLAGVLVASIARPRPGAIYNVCDDEPAAPEAVVAHAASLLGLPAPPLVPFEAAGLSPMARSFYDDNKRVSNALIKIGARGQAALSELPRGVGRDPCGRRLILDILPPTSSTGSGEDFTCPLTTY